MDLNEPENGGTGGESGKPDTEGGATSQPEISSHETGETEAGGGEAAQPETIGQEPGQPQSSANDAGQPETSDHKGGFAAGKGKVLIGAVLAVCLIAILFLVNRYWITPAVRTQANSSQDHPDAPAFSLTDITGKKLDLADYKGKVVVLDFWATWCGPCRIEIPELIEIQNKYASQGFTVIGLSMDDDSAPVVDFYKDFRMNYPVAVANQRVGELYGGVFGLPTTFVIGRDGRIYAKHVGAVSGSVIADEVQQLLTMNSSSENTEFKPHMTAGTETKIELGDPATIDSEIPGLNLTKLTATQKEDLKKQLAGQQCTCGCNLTVLKCRQVDRSCRVSLKIAQDQLDKLLKSGA